MIYDFKDKRIQGVVSAVVQHLPSDAKKKLFHVWKATDDPQAIWYAGGEGGLEGAARQTACAQKGYAGAVVFINSQATIGMEVSKLGAIIAHEFAHCCLGHLDISAKSFAANEREFEQEAEALAGQWGFRRLLLEQRPHQQSVQTFGEIQL